MSSRLYIAALALVAALLLACSGSNTSTAPPVVTGTSTAPGSVTPSGPTPTPTISLTPKAQATPTDPSAAHLLEEAGQLSDALPAYLSFANQTTATGADGTFGAARVLLELDRPADARTLLEPFLASAPATLAGPGHYLLARAYTALQMPNEALHEYEAYIQTGRPAVAYAHIDHARVLVDANQPLTAVSEIQQAMPSLPTASQSTLLGLIASAYERAGDQADARVTYQKILDTSQSTNDQALALSKIAGMKKAAGDASYVADEQKLLANYPATSQATDALNDLLAGAVPVDTYLQGLVAYKHNDYPKAASFFSARVAAAPNDPANAETYYYLGAIDESREQTSDAEDAYARTYTLNPQSSLADDAMWWRARLLENDGKYSDADALYSRLASDYPSSQWATDASFRHGLQAYRSGHYSDAASAWADSLASTSDPTERERLMLWRGKALIQGGDKQNGKALLTDLAASAENDYYGIRAGSIVAGQDGQSKASRDPKAELSESFDWTAAESWLSQKVGQPIPPASAAAWAPDDRWLRAQELWLVGRTTQGDTEAFNLIDADNRDPVAMYTLSRSLQASGHIGLSARAGQRLLRDLNTLPNAGLPKALLSLSYPPAFAASVQRYAQEAKISPLLMLAFIRQESFFDPRAESGVGAVGLTQMLPETGKSVAQKLGITDFDPDTLVSADTNARLGARYMADLLGNFGDHISIAFAAYNAGPDAAQRWAKVAGDDPDLFLEMVEFSETRLYVEFVSENYAIYRYLYAGEPVPDLPGN